MIRILLLISILFICSSIYVQKAANRRYKLLLSSDLTQSKNDDLFTVAGFHPLVDALCIGSYKAGKSLIF